MKTKEKFKQLTSEQRQIIEAKLLQGWLQKDIASLLEVNKSTISREVANRSRNGHYWAEGAQADYQQRRSVCHPSLKINNHQATSYLKDKVIDGWSPEQISGRLKLDIQKGLKTKTDYIGYETIYKIVYETEFGRQHHLSDYLRRGKKHRTDKHGRRSQKCLIINRNSIDNRPEVVNLRQRFGDWESDSIIYPHKRAINSLVERKTLLTLLTKLRRKTATETLKAVTYQLQCFPAETITFDNGSENSLHHQIGYFLGAKTYFCHPYHSWEKGTNENTNGLVRRYLPHHRNINDLTQAELDLVARALNHRPRKKLGFYTPVEMLKLAGYKLISCNQI